MSKKSKGQYFTKSRYLQNEVYKLILNEPELILEPSVGRGDLVNYIKNYKSEIIFDMYEIDKNIKVLDSIKVEDINYYDFLEINIEKKYKTIIGNPPYVKTNKGNLYIDFIKKCYKLLEYNGELIFIIPSDFFKLSHSHKLINNMINNGTFTHIIHPHNEKLFEEANIDVLIFRYYKNKELTNKILYNNLEKYIINNGGILTFNDINIDINQYKKINEYFDIYVGIVSGKEDIYKNSEYGNIKILNGENKEDTYILIKEFPTTNKNLNKYLLENKDILINRKIRKFTEQNWFEWGALRNFEKITNIINTEPDKRCIYIHNLTRKENVAFIDKINYLGGNLLILIPKTNINIDLLLNYFNSNDFKKKYTYSNRFKIGHKELSNHLFEFSKFC